MVACAADCPDNRQRKQQNRYRREEDTIEDILSHRAGTRCAMGCLAPDDVSKKVRDQQLEDRDHDWPSVG